MGPTDVRSRGAAGLCRRRVSMTDEMAEDELQDLPSASNAISNT